jgi:hypothetical protein
MRGAWPREGVTPRAADRGVAVIVRSLAAQGPLTRSQLAVRVAAAGVRSAGQVLVHLLMVSSLRGLTVRGPMLGRQHAYVLVRDWLGPSAPVDRNQALAELARRYLLGHGPATDRDLATWAGIPLRDARVGLNSIASHLDHRENGLVDLARRPAAAELPPPRLLGAFDPVLLGWTSREPILAAHAAAVISGGLFRPFALVRGRAVATWSMPDGKVVLEAFGRLSGKDSAALSADAQDVVRFIGHPQRRVANPAVGAPPSE